MRRHLRVARLLPEKVLIAFKRSSTAAVPQQHEEAFKADFDPFGGLIGQWGLLGRGVKKMCNPRNFSSYTAYTSKKQARGESSTALAQQITKEGGSICLRGLSFQ